MQINTVQTLIDYVKDITGQDNISNAKVIRHLNFAVDHYSYLRVTSSGTWNWDSRNQTDLPRVTATLTGDKLSLENELMAIEHVEALKDGKYYTVEPLNQRERSEPLDTIYNSSGLPKFYDYDSRHLRFFPNGESTTIRVTYSRAHPRYLAGNLTQSTGVLPVHEEYIALYASDKVMLGMNDPMRAQIKNEIKEKEQEIRDLASKQDRDTGRRLKGKIPSAFTSRSRGKR